MKRNALMAALLLTACLNGQETRREPRASAPSRPSESAGRPRAALGSQASLSEEQERILAKGLLDLALDDEGARAKAIERLADLAGLVPLRISASFGHELARVRVGAVRVFRLAPQPCVADPAVGLFRDKSAEVRAEAVLLVSKLAPAGHVAELLVLLRHESEPRVLRQVVAAIAAAGDLDAVPHLVDTLGQTTDAYIRKKCADALRTLTGAAVKADSEAWREWWTEHEPRVRREQRRMRPGGDREPEAGGREQGGAGLRENGEAPEGGRRARS